MRKEDIGWQISVSATVSLKRICISLCLTPFILNSMRSDGFKGNYSNVGSLRGQGKVCIQAKDGKLLFGQRQEF